MMFDVLVLFFKDPSRFGFGGARMSERISLKAAAVQLASGALHNW